MKVSTTHTKKRDVKFGTRLHVDVRDTAGDHKEHEGAVANALRDLNRQMKKAEVLNDLRKKEHFVKPSVAKRLKRIESARKSRMESQ